MTKSSGDIRKRKLKYLIDTAFNGRQLDFCDKSDVAQSLVSRYLHGKVIGDNMARKIELACGLDPGWLDDATNLPPEVERRKEVDMGEPELYKLIGLITKLPERERRRLRKIYEVLANNLQENNMPDEQ